MDRVLAKRYELGDVLGRGGAAKVHRAWDRKLGRDVAVKVFHTVPELRRFDNETRVLAMLTHPGLVDVYDVGVDERLPYIVLRLVDGDTLREVIAGGPMAVDDVRALGARLASALAYVHARGVAHRDVKPSNILLDGSGTPFLADFGVARLVGSERITAVDEMIGTAAYMAPEQVRGHEVGAEADVYSLGLVLLECLTGSMEYEGTGVESAVARLHRPPVIPGSLPGDLALLLSRMTALTPRRRPTAQECAHALSSVGSPADVTEAQPAPTLTAIPVVAEPVPGGGTPGAGARGRGGLWAGLAAGVAGVVGVGAWLWGGVDGAVTPPAPANAVEQPSAGGGTAESQVVKPVAQEQAPIQVHAGVEGDRAAGPAKPPAAKSPPAAKPAKGKGAEHRTPPQGKAKGHKP